MYLCPECYNKGKKPFCVVCFLPLAKEPPPPKLTTQEKNKMEIEKEAAKQRRASLKRWWEQLKAFNMDTTGSEEVDNEILEMFGPWNDT